MIYHGIMGELDIGEIKRVGSGKKQKMIPQSQKKVLYWYHTDVSSKGEQSERAAFLVSGSGEREIMLKSCPYCGKIHDSRISCDKKPKRRYRRTKEESGRYTAAWVKKSEEIKKSSYYLCAVCLNKGDLVSKELEVHHIEKLRDRPDLLLCNHNLICLCQKHHKEAENGKIPMEYLKKLAAEREKGLPPGLDALWSRILQNHPATSKKEKLPK